MIHRSSGDAARVQRLGAYAIEALIDRAEETAGTAFGPRTLWASFPGNPAFNLLNVTTAHVR